MKKLILVTVLGGGLALPPNQTIEPVLTNPPIQLTIQPIPQAIPVIPGAIVIGAGVGLIGWAAIKCINNILRIRERQLTNTPPEDVVFTNYQLEDDYPE